MRHYREGEYGKEGYKTLSWSPLYASGEVLKDLDYNIEDVKEKVKSIIKEIS